MDAPPSTPPPGRSITFPTDRNEALLVQLLGREFDLPRDCGRYLGAREAGLEILDATAECDRLEDWPDYVPWGSELYPCALEQHQRLNIVFVATDTAPPQGHPQDTLYVAAALSRWCALQPAFDPARHRIDTITLEANNATSPTVQELQTFEDRCRSVVQNRLRELVIVRGAVYLLFDRGVPALRDLFETTWKERLVPNGVPIYTVQKPHNATAQFEPPKMEPRERAIRLEDETRRAYASVAAGLDHRALAEQILKATK